jgi:hypothetical protein
LAARLLNLTAPTQPDTAIVTFKAMTERFLLEKEAAKKKTIKSDRQIIAELLVAFGQRRR